MDNTKTGALIREARKQAGLTQLELAEKLHVSDRAVSKWERGLCAPDIALLEPLGEALGLSITELISGERKSEEAESAVRETISYSQTELHRKSRTARGRVIAMGILGALLGIALFFAFQWYRGGLFVLGRYPSPDGETVTTVYSRKIGYGEIPEKGGFTLSDEGYFSGRTIYSGADFQGLWWSPDGKYQVVSMYAWSEDWDGGGETILSLADFKRNIGCNLDARLRNGMYGNAFFEDVPWDEERSRRLIEFDFVQWSQYDPAKMLIYFSYTDGEKNFREGYFWYDYESGLVSGEMEIEQEEKQEDFLHGLLD